MDNASLFVSHGVNHAFGMQRLFYMFYWALLNQLILFQERVVAACGISGYS